MVLYQNIWISVYSSVWIDDVCHSWKCPIYDDLQEKILQAKEYSSFHDCRMFGILVFLCFSAVFKSHPAFLTLKADIHSEANFPFWERPCFWYDKSSEQHIPPGDFISYSLLS